MGQVRKGQVKILSVNQADEVKLGQFKLGEVRSVQIEIGQVQKG